MRKFAILVTVLSFSGSAFAADMAVKAPPPPPAVASAYSWTGFYIGGNGGYGWSDPTVSVTGNDFVSFGLTCGGMGGGTCVPPASYNISGGLGGPQFGYNWQFNRNWLLGFETDFDWSKIQGTGTSNFLVGAPAANPSNFQTSEDVKWFGTVRARLGFLPTNNLLLYATGGFAYGSVAENAAINSTATGGSGGGFTFNCNSLGGTGTMNCFVGSSTRTTAGFAVGGGVEHALWNNISVKAEYLYVDLGPGGTVDVVAQAKAPGFAGNAPSSFSAAYSRTDFQVVRAGLNWKFW